MNQELICWLLGIMITLLAAFAGAGITAYIGIVQRMTRIETTIELLGVNAAKALHCPTTPDMDVLLEKYYERNYELTNEEWQTVLNYYQAVLDDMSQPRALRVAAGQLVAVCHHKLKHDPPLNWKVK